MKTLELAIIAVGSLVIALVLMFPVVNPPEPRPMYLNYDREFDSFAQGTVTNYEVVAGFERGVEVKDIDPKTQFPSHTFSFYSSSGQVTIEHTGNGPRHPRCGAPDPDGAITCFYIQ